MVEETKKPGEGDPPEAKKPGAGDPPEAKKPGAGDPPETAPAGVTPEAQLAAAQAAAAEKAPKIPMKAPEGVTSVSVNGKEVKVPKSGNIKVELEHVAHLIAHGFEVVMDDLEKL